MNKRFIALSVAVLMVLTIFAGCTQREEIDIPNANEFEESITKKYNIGEVNIIENSEDKSMVIQYYFQQGGTEQDIQAVKYESLVYYKPREGDYGKLTVEIFDNDKNQIRSFVYENNQWMD